MSQRFDHRSQKRFEKDIYFGTMMEKYFMEKFVIQPQVTIHSYRDNGCGNDGEFIESGCTAGADYIVDFDYNGREYRDFLLEIKWVPTCGKFTLKKDDLKAYTKEQSNILFIYNTDSPSLKRPGDYNLEKLQDRIERLAPQIKWGIMFHDTVSKLIDWYDIKHIHYMGNKLGIVIPSRDFSGLFKEEQWEI